MKNVLNRLNMTPTILARRLIIYVLGIYLMTLGVSFSVTSDLGVSPVNSIPYVLSEVLGVQMGIVTMGVYCCYLAIQAILLGRDFKPIRLLQLLCTVLFGWFVDLNNWLTGLFLPDPTNYLVRLLYLVISMVLVALGIFLYLGPHLLSLPGEGCMQVISDKFHIPLHRVKMGFDITVSFIALIISLIAFHTFHGVREGTVLAALGVGKFLGMFARLFRMRLNNFMDLDEEGLEQVKATQKAHDYLGQLIPATVHVRFRSDMPIQRREGLYGGHGTVLSTVVLTPEELMGRATLFKKFFLKPGDTIGEHTHYDDAEIYYILKGQLVLIQDGRDISLREGDAVFCANHGTHSLENRSNDVAEYLVLLMP